MSNAYKKALKQAYRSLKWGVQIDRQGSTADPDAYAMSTDALARTHNIVLPRVSVPGSPFRPESELHELQHAWLAENVHPIFGTRQFVDGVSDELVEFYRWPINQAGDWFANGRTDCLFPGLRATAIEGLRRYFKDEYVAFNLSVDPLAAPFILSELAAEYSRAAGWTGQLPELLEELRREYLETDPDQPSLAAMVELVNRLVAYQGDDRLDVIALPTGEFRWRIVSPPQSNLGLEAA